MSTRTNAIVKIAVLSAVAFVVMLIETPPLFSTFLKMDFSDIVAVIGGFAISPLAALLIQVIKNIMHLPLSTTSGIGELGNLIVGASFAYSAAYLYHLNKTKRQAIKSLVVAVLVMTLAAILANYFILLPLYAYVLGITIDILVEITHAVNPFVTDKLSFILYAVAPFNLIKGCLVSAVTLLVYKSISRLLGDRQHIVQKRVDL